jgi:hypothetical protein
LVSTVHRLPAATALVLRDRTNADAGRMLATALHDLLAGDTWTLEQRRRRRPPWRVADLLAPAAEPAPAALPEPLGTIDAALRAAATALGAPVDVETLARWTAGHAPTLPWTAAKHALEDLIARGLLERAPRAGRPDVVDLVPTAAGRAALDAARFLPPGPLGARFLEVWRATPSGVGGFAFGSVGAANWEPGQHAPPPQMLHGSSGTVGGGFWAN